VPSPAAKISTQVLQVSPDELPLAAFRDDVSIVDFSSIETRLSIAYLPRTLRMLR
jgi:hypothetical protein